MLLRTAPKAISGLILCPDGAVGFAIRHDHRGSEYYCATDYSMQSSWGRESCGNDSSHSLLETPVSVFTVQGAERSMSEEKVPASSPEVPNRRTLTIEDVEEALAQAFQDVHEQRWAREAWAGLIKLGLADYSTEMERSDAAVRFIALAGFYNDWQEQTEECDRPFERVGILAAFNLTSFRLGQLIGHHPDFLDDCDFDPYSGSSSDERLLEEAIFHLEVKARPTVVMALMAHYGSISGLFVALWNSNKQPRPADYDQRWEEYDSERAWDMELLHMWIPPYQDTDDEILNDLTDDKMRLWTWLDQHPSISKST
jgi:hypothetical protein